MAIPLPTRRLGPLLSILLFCAGVCPDLAGGPADYTYRTDTSEVRLTFSALDQNNHGVATLRAQDIAVVDKDVIVRRFQSFTRTDWTKLELAILVDASDSVRPHFRQETADIVDLVAQTTGVPDENLSIFTFAGPHPAVVCAGDCRTSALAERLPARSTAAMTPLFDTIVFAANSLGHHGEPQAEKILIVFSDGTDTISRYSLAEAIDAALKSEVQLDCIDLNPAARTQGAGSLRRLASASGGRYFPPPHGAQDALNAILEGFRASYTVTYRLPSHSIGFHEVRIVPTRNLNLQFLNRSGYYYPNQVQ